MTSYFCFPRSYRHFLSLTCHRWLTDNINFLSSSSLWTLYKAHLSSFFQTSFAFKKTTTFPPDNPIASSSIFRIPIMFVHFESTAVHVIRVQEENRTEHTLLKPVRFLNFASL